METSYDLNLFRKTHVTKNTIRLIKEANKEKLVNKHKVFHKIYKAPLRKTENNISPCPQSMCLTESSMKYTQTTDSLHPKKFFGRDGNFPLPKSTFYTTQSNSKFTEEDGVLLTRIFNIKPEGSSFNYLTNPNCTKEEKNEVCTRFNINKKLNDKENLMIQNVIKSEHMLGSRLGFSLQGPSYFDNAKDALKSIKVNSQIIQKVNEIRSNLQYDRYMDKINQMNDQIIKITQMPPITIRKSNKRNSLLAMSSVPIEPAKIEDMRYDDDSYLLKNYQKSHSKMLYTKSISRDQLLTELEVDTFYLEIAYKPTARAQFSLTLEGNHVYLFGGINGQKFCDMWTCEIKDTIKWTKLKISEEDEPTPRCGHTAVIYQRSLYIYGGVTPKDHWKPREDMLVFNLVTCNYLTPKVGGRAEVGWRRNHIAVGVGNLMFVHGGMDDNDRILSDSWTYDYSKSKWFPLEIKGNKLPGLAFHSAELVAEYEKMIHPGFTIYKMNDVPINKNKVTKIKYEGVYIFGGMDENRNLVNDMRVVKIGKKPVEIIMLKTSGQPPSPRISTAMCFIQDLNLLVIHGGRNDKDRSIIYNDFVLLDLETLTWIRPVFGNNPPPCRAEHEIFLYEDRIYILGGVNEFQYHQFDFWNCTLGFYNSEKKVPNWVSSVDPPPIRGKNKRKTKIRASLTMVE